MIDFTCDLNCPGAKGICCLRCYRSRKDFVNEANKHLWSDSEGFLGKDGCRLPREQIPDGCKCFDCHKYGWLIDRRWIGNKWVDFDLGQVLPGQSFVVVDITKCTE